jgi:hypothetical protein
MDQKEALEEKQLGWFNPEDKPLYNLHDFLSCSLSLLDYPTFSTLPDQVLWNCATFLSVSEIITASQLSKRMSRAFGNQVLWEILLARDFDLEGNPNIDGDKRPSVMYSDVFKQIKRSRRQRMERSIARKKKISQVQDERSKSW